MAEPIDYYVAGILFLLKDMSSEFISVEKLESWGVEKSSAFGDSYRVKYFESPGLFKEALKSLDKTGAIKLIDDPYGPTIIKILKERYLYEFEEFEPELVLSKTASFGESWISTALLNLNASSIDEYNIEVEDVNENIDWQPLPIDREDPVYHEALKAVEDAMRVIESDNGYAVTAPEERDAIITSLKGGSEALKNGSPTQKYLKDTLVSGFSYLAKKFTDSAIGVAAKKALEALLLFAGL